MSRQGKSIDAPALSSWADAAMRNKYQDPVFDNRDKDNLDKPYMHVPPDSQRIWINTTSDNGEGSSALSLSLTCQRAVNLELCYKRDCMQAHHMAADRLCREENVPRCRQARLVPEQRPALASE
jgi:hypothetical protein